MLTNILVSAHLYTAVMVGVTFLMGFLSLKYFMKLLPKDHGREDAVNGELSRGKPRGAGIIMISVFVLCCALFVPFSIEMVVNMVLIFAAMLTGYFDDAADVSWGELKKGLLDLVITVGLTVNFMLCNSTDIVIFGHDVHIPVALYAVLCLALIWVSINVTNCCDGVDGMCASLSIVTLALFLLCALPNEMSSMTIIMIFVLASYLWFNCSPSRLLMGDAGSRAIGVFLALAALHSGDPFRFLPFACMIIIDGGIGLVKLSFRRFLKLTNFMDKIRTPLHDHWRKNLGVGDTQVVVRFAIIQLAVGAVFLTLI
ncbi:MAG: phospho-N-acetylmuramoyl-pentapeptide-transferase [Ruminococcus sp.]|nr:phospho-N-acetylmuramoyl-pentapeptide-transferase [Ruminococcus sp.]